MIGRNILANALGGSSQAILTLLIIPIQVRVFGTEAFGLLSFIAAVQIVFSVFDLGLSPTIAREVAIDASPDLRHSRELLQTLSPGYVAVGLLLGGGLAGSAGWLVDHWFDLGALPPDTARTVLLLGGVTVAIRWPVSFYGGVLIGRGRFDVLNGLKAGAAAFGLLGGAVVILATASLVAFAAWMALAAAVEVSLYLVACFRLVPGLSPRPRFSRPVLAHVWRSALSVATINVLAIAVTQSDRLLLSALAPIESVGYYSLAYNVLQGLGLVQGFFTSAMLPVFAADHGAENQDALSAHYGLASQALIALYTLPIMLFVFFGHDILRVVSSAKNADAAAGIMAVLAVGFGLNASVSMSSTLAIAIKRTRRLIAVSGYTLIVYFPALYLLILRWEGLGAALAWVFLNGYYVVAWLPFVHRAIVRSTLADWLRGSIVPFLGCGLVAFGTARAVVSLAGWQRLPATLAICGVASLVYGALGYRFLDAVLRNAISSRVRGTVARFVPAG